MREKLRAVLQKNGELRELEKLVDRKARQRDLEQRLAVVVYTRQGGVPMDLKTFMESEWVKAASSHETRQKILDEFPKWAEKVRDSELAGRARRLWAYLISEKCSTGDQVLAVAALLYLISPIDLIPDFIPVAGWLDDMIVAGLVLGYLDKKAAGAEATTAES